MSKDISNSRNEKLRRSMEEARERSAEPSVRDILKREYDEAQMRPRNKALEKWGPVIEAQIMRDLDARQRTKVLQKNGVEIERE